MPLQQALITTTDKLQLGHEAFNYLGKLPLSAYSQEVWDQSYQADFGTIVGYDPATSKWAKPTATTAQLAIVTRNNEMLSRAYVLAKETIDLEVMGARMLKTITGITVKKLDPVYVYVAGANAGLLSNVADATPANTRLVEGYFLQDKPSSEVSVGVFLNLIRR